MTQIKCIDSKTIGEAQLFHGDCIEVLAQLPDNCIDFSIYSPPFSSLYVYSDSIRDMGNNPNDDDFFKAYSFLIKEKFRITRPGRISAVHCKNILNTKWKDGEISLRDFRGEIIRKHQEAGWMYHSEVAIWKDPVVEMQRTKSHGLLYKTLKSDASNSRMGLADYLVVFKKDGKDSAVEHTPDEIPLSLWQKIASPIWMDIDQGKTLNYKVARDDKDERHICPLQLDVIERAILLWSKKGDVVLSPFMGVGSEGYMARTMKRKFIGVELKKAYFDHACKNIEDARDDQIDMFGDSLAL